MTSSAGRYPLPTSRRGSPASEGLGQSNNYFMIGQGGRLTLPPISDFANPSRFPAPHVNPAYAQPRSARPVEFDMVYDHYPTPSSYTSAGSSPQFSNAYPSYSPQQQYTYPRASTPITLSLPPVDTRRQRPPVSTSPGPGANGDRWPQQTSYLQPTPSYPTTTSMRSPATSYHNPYPHTPSSAGNAYSYHMPQDPLSMSLPVFDNGPRMDHPRSASPYRSNAGPHSSLPPPPSLTPPPLSPMSPEEPTIKKKRKRADAAQLKVLNETYARTAFPSTEERIALAKLLDMSARSVQIWFQNKRQSMRQTNRQSANTAASSHHPYAVSGQGIDHATESLGHHTSAYDGGSSMSNSLYLTPSAEPVGRSHGSHSHSHYSTSSHRHSAREPSDYHPKWTRPC